MEHNYTNELINETSPYLLQHAHNPVLWKPWNQKTLKSAVKTDSLIIISIGYSACHWCHVMEHESFEDVAVAKVMNDHYVNIKVDREERPDVDQVYMSAVQLMTGQGGWPLNIIALPDGRPVWGGTYFRKEEWSSALLQIAELYKNEPEKLYEYAEKLSNGIKEADLIPQNPNPISFSNETLETAIQNWSKQWDTRQGGLNRAPKFMMPTNYHFLLRYGHQTGDQEIMDYVNATLEMMAYGGINDHVGGGFARYSTDMKWHIPHFEKMLYDNGQLVSLYSDAYLKTKNPLYRETVYQTLDFISREMTTSDGAFYSALDADSLTEKGNLEEGAYYVWTKKELEKIIGSDMNLFTAYYHINSYGHWEHDQYVLIKQDSDIQFCKEHGLELDEFKIKIDKWHEDLLRFRESNKARPRLDDKILTSWNALMLKGYLDAYRVFQEPEFLEIAETNALFIKNHLLKKDGSLYRTHKNGKSTINGFLEDYATAIDAFLTLFELTGKMEWLQLTKKLIDYSIDKFHSEENSLFYYTSKDDAKLPSRNFELYDNVIPASNSVMATVLHKLSYYFIEENYQDISSKMLHHLQPNFTQSPTSYSNWLSLLLNFTKPYYEIVIVGENAKNILEEFNSHYLPNTLKAISTTASELSIFKGRFKLNKTLIYVCKNNTCTTPVETVEQALTLMKLT